MANEKKGGGGKPSTGGSLPPAPTGLTVSMSGANVLIKWDPVPGATSYWVFRNGLVGWIVQTLDYVDAYVISGQTYTYNVAAVVNSVRGNISAPVSITIP